MKARLPVVASALLFLTASGVRGQEPDRRPGEREALLPAIQAYLDAAVDTLARVSRHSTVVDWLVLRDSARLLARGARAPKDVYPVIDWLLQRVDKHSFLQANWFGVRGDILEGRFGYVRVPFFQGGMEPTLADTLQAIIRRGDQPTTCGWIVDLRANGGGNMWPMLAGIGPLLSDSIAGWNQEMMGRSVWKYHMGTATLVELDGTEMPLVTVSTAPHRLRNPGAPVAVLIDGGTASSGEAIAVSFRGRGSTRFFGSATAGVSTTNAGFRLPDGANMVITIGAYADRTGALYENGVAPDEEIATQLRGPTVLTGDPVMARAQAWLKEQPACR